MMIAVPFTPDNFAMAALGRSMRMHWNKVKPTCRKRFRMLPARVWLRVRRSAFNVLRAAAHATEGACQLAGPWFAALSSMPDRPAASIEGNTATLDEAVGRAAEILRESRAPLIWGLSRSSTGGQRAAVLLADKIGATVDTTASVCHGPSIMAIQQVGESTCSLGEVRNATWLSSGAPTGDKPSATFRAIQRRCDRVICSTWPGGSACIVIDSEETETSRLADTIY